MALKFCNLFYSVLSGSTQTLDATHEYSAGDNTGTIVSIAVINTDAALYGTYGLDCPTGSDRIEFAVSSGDIISSSVGSFQFAFRFAAWEADTIIFRAHNSAAVTNWIRVVTGSTNNVLTFGIRLAGGISHSISTASANLQTGTVYIVTCRYDEPNNDIRIEIRNSSGTLIDSAEDLTTNFDQPSGIDTLQIGVSQNGDTFDLHIDNVLIADAYAEPLEENFDITSYTEYGAAALDPIRLVWRQ